MTNTCNNEKGIPKASQQSAGAIYDLLCQLPADLLSVSDRHPADPPCRHDIEAGGD